MAYLGKTPSQAVRSRYYYTATGGETSLSGADDNSNVLTFTDGNYVDVSLNGATLVAGSDYNTTTTNTIGGLAALTASDIVEIVVYDTFSVFGGNMAADLNFKDNVKANFGTGKDLVIYHDGSNSILDDVGTGNLQLQISGSPKLEITTSGIDVTGTVTADGLTVDTNTLHVDATNNRVGIGTSSPATALTVASEGKLRLYRSDNARYGDIYNDNSSFNIETSNDPIKLDGQSYIRFDVAADEKVRIDSSGNLLVGTTSSINVGSGSDVGVMATNNGGLVAYRSNDIAAFFGRQLTDGDIVQFRKDGTTVGSIGAYGGATYYTGPASGVMFNGVQIEPTTGTGSTRTNNTNDIGSSSYRFKDLYLSGGVYLGGTGSANHLDDYEEGSFVPTLTGEGACNITLSLALGQYNKVGRIVNVTMFFQVSAVSGGSSGLAVSIGNLPFTTNTNLNTTGSIRAQNLNSGLTASALMVSIYNNSTGGRIEEWTGSTAANLSDHIASNSNFAISVTYSIT